MRGRAAAPTATATRATVPWAASALAAVVALAASCTLPPAGGTTTTPPSPGAPVVASFLATVPTAAPAVVTFSWAATDPEGDALTCALDVDGDGLAEATVHDCSGATSRNVTAGAAGSRTARLTVTDSTGAATSATRTWTVAVGTSETMDVVIRPVGSLGPTASAAFASAEARIEQVVARGITDVTASVAAGACLPGAAPIEGVVDDVVIDAQVTPIDGVGGVVGSAGPCLVYSGDGLPRLGVMQFDSADVAQMAGEGVLEAVVLHEMAHVLGFGTIWPDTPLLVGAGSGDPRYGGAAGTAEWSALGGAGLPPVEADGGPGTAESHWDEATFGAEVMTGWADRGAALPFSRLSVAALADLGYRVDLSQADAFSLPSFLLRSLRSSATVPEGSMALLRPRGTIPR